jgi:hypothetical protein
MRGRVGQRGRSDAEEWSAEIRICPNGWCATSGPTTWIRGAETGIDPHTFPHWIPTVMHGPGACECNWGDIAPLGRSIARSPSAADDSEHRLAVALQACMPGSSLIGLASVIVVLKYQECLSILPPCPHQMTIKPHVPERQHRYRPTSPPESGHCPQRPSECPGGRRTCSGNGTGSHPLASVGNSPRKSPTSGADRTISCGTSAGIRLRLLRWCRRY